MNLSPHFNLAEFTHSDYALEHGIDNTPPAAIISNLKLMAATMEEVRGLFGQPIIPSSGYRCLAVNAGVLGDKQSAHLEGLACDFTIPGISNKEAALRIAASNIDFDQLILEYGWIHLGLRINRRQLLTKRGKYAPYLAGIV
jgi:hypothetical protein